MLELLMWEAIRAQKMPLGRKHGMPLGMNSAVVILLSDIRQLLLANIACMKRSFWVVPLFGHILLFRKNTFKRAEQASSMIPL